MERVTAGKHRIALLAASLLAHPTEARNRVPEERTTVFAKSHDCGDLLSRMRRKPVHLIYEGCRYLPKNQGKPLVATYRVQGRYAAVVARSLRHTSGMNKVKKVCCQWEALRSQFTDARGQDYTIWMVSEETVHLTRDAWPKIDRFEVVVETYTEEI